MTQLWRCFRVINVLFRGVLRFFDHGRARTDMDKKFMDAGGVLAVRSRLSQAGKK